MAARRPSEEASAPTLGRPPHAPAVQHAHPAASGHGEPQPYMSRPYLPHSISRLHLRRRAAVAFCALLLAETAAVEGGLRAPLAATSTPPPARSSRL